MVKYWKRMYGTRSNEFIEGLIAGITVFAVNKDGKQTVGILSKSLKEVISEIKEELGYVEK